MKTRMRQWIVLSMVFAGLAQGAEATRMSPRLTEDRYQWWLDARFGMFIHWGTYAMAARHEWVKNHERMPDDVYQKYFDRFDPDLYDPREWARAARNAGMRYFVITTKHHAVSYTHLTLPTIYSV